MKCAYDYDTQQWVEGDAADDLIRIQDAQDKLYNHYLAGLLTQEEYTARFDAIR